MSQTISGESDDFDKVSSMTVRDNKLEFFWLMKTSKKDVKRSSILVFHRRTEFRRDKSSAWTWLSWLHPFGIINCCNECKVASLLPLLADRPFFVRSVDMGMARMGSTGAGRTRCDKMIIVRFVMDRRKKF